MRKLLLALLLAAIATLGVRAGGAPPGSPDVGRVTRVVDGDTLHVDVGGRDETVRLLGIDTPELHKPAVPVECGARRAADVLARLAQGKRVELVDDPTQDRRDYYDRRLAYVVLRGSGTDLGETLVRRGWASVYVFEAPFARVREYRRAARAAEAEDRGVNGRCDGDFHSEQ